MACQAAKRLVTEGIQLIERYGAFKGDVPAQVVAAIEGKVPVGNMMYNDVERQKLVDFFNK